MMTAVTRPPRHLRWWLLVAVAAALVSLGFVPDVREFLLRGYAALTSPDPDVTRTFVEGLGWAGPLALIAAFVVQAVIPVIPSLVLILVSVRAYGYAEGFLIVYLGIVLGAVAGYWLGRALGDPLVRALAGERARNAAHKFATENGVRGVVMVRLMPILPAEAMNLVAGAAGMGFRPFLLATMLGVLPVTVLVVWLSGSTQRLMVGLGVLSAVVGLYAAFRVWQQRRARLTG